MAFWDDEKSLAAGKPIELHQFQARGTSTYWRYADAPADITYGNTFSACYVKGEKIEQGSNALRNQTKVLCDWDNPFAWQYTSEYPEQCIDYTRYKGHGANFVTQFTGVVVAVRFLQEDRGGPRHAEILIDPAANDLRTAGLVLRSGRQCQVALYSTPCGVARAAYRTAGIVATVSGRIVTADALTTQPSGWFRGGDFVVGAARRKIVSHITDTIILSRTIYGLTAGMGFDAYAGCDHLCVTCASKFDNVANFRGQPLIPDANPWEDAVT